MEREPKTDQRG